MIRMVLGALLGVLAVSVIVPGFRDGHTVTAGFENLFFAVALLVVPGILLVYFGWCAREAKSRLVTRRHAAFLLGAGLAVVYAMLVGTILTSTTSEAGAAISGLSALLALPAAILMLVGWRSGPVVIGPADLLPRAHERPEREVSTSPDCAICGASDAVDVYYRFPAVARSFGGVSTRVQYDSSVYDAVRICSGCIDRKRDRARPALWALLVVSLPFCVFLVGVFGVIAAAGQLWELRDRQEVGDLMAADWLELRKVTLWPGLMPEGGGLTRKGFTQAKAREGRDAFGRPLAPYEQMVSRRPPTGPPGS
jgi:hypothetical protein